MFFDARERLAISRFPGEEQTACTGIPLSRVSRRREKGASCRCSISLLDIRFPCSVSASVRISLPPRATRPRPVYLGNFTRGPLTSWQTPPRFPKTFPATTTTTLLFSFEPGEARRGARFNALSRFARAVRKFGESGTRLGFFSTGSSDWPILPWYCIFGEREFWNNQRSEGWILFTPPSRVDHIRDRKRTLKEGGVFRELASKERTGMIHQLLYWYTITIYHFQYYVISLQKNWTF